jgi:hypothetical protein
MNHLLEQCLEPINEGILDFEHWLINNDNHIPFGSLPQSFIDEMKSNRLDEIGELVSNNQVNYIFFDEDVLVGIFLEDNQVLYNKSIFFNKEKWRQLKLDYLINEC